MIRKHLITHKNKDLEVQKITQQNKMKYDKNLKNIKHTLGTKEKITKTIHKKKNKKHNKNKKHLNLQSNNSIFTRLGVVMSISILSIYNYCFFTNLGFY